MKLETVVKRAIKNFPKLLRSGKYKQGKHYLKRELDGEVCHCALGVLMEELVVKAPSEFSWSENMGLFSFNSRIYSNYIPDLVEEQMEELGLDAGDVLIWNDTADLSFDEIATNVEKKLKEGAKREQAN